MDFFPQPLQKHLRWWWRYIPGLSSKILSTTHQLTYSPWNLSNYFKRLLNYLWGSTHEQLHISSSFPVQSHLWPGHSAGHSQSLGTALISDPSQLLRREVWPDTKSAILVTDLSLIFVHLNTRDPSKSTSSKERCSVKDQFNRNVTTARSTGIFKNPEIFTNQLKKVSPGNLHLSNYKEKDFHAIVL